MCLLCLRLTSCPFLCVFINASFSWQLWLFWLRPPESISFSIRAICWPHGKLTEVNWNAHSALASRLVHHHSLYTGGTVVQSQGKMYMSNNEPIHHSSLLLVKDTSRYASREEGFNPERGGVQRTCFSISWKNFRNNAWKARLDIKKRKTPAPAALLQVELLHPCKRKKETPILSKLNLAGWKQLSPLLSRQQQSLKLQCTKSGGKHVENVLFSPVGFPGWWTDMKTALINYFYIKSKDQITV